MLAKIREQQNAPRMPGKAPAAGRWSAVQNLVGTRLKVQLKEITYEGNKAIAKLQRWVHEAVMASELDAEEASVVSTVLGNVSGGIERFMKGSKKTPEFKKAAKKHIKRCKQWAKAHREASGKPASDAAPARRPAPPPPMLAARLDGEPPALPQTVPRGSPALMPNRSRTHGDKASPDANPTAKPAANGDKLGAMAKLYGAGPSKPRVLYGDFDITFDRFSRISQPCAPLTRRVAHSTLVPTPIGC